MNYFNEIRTLVNDFCKASPANGFEINYLQNAKRLLSLYEDASAIMEEDEVDSRKLEEIYNKIQEIIE